MGTVVAEGLIEDGWSLEDLDMLVTDEMLDEAHAEAPLMADALALLGTAVPRSSVEVEGSRLADAPVLSTLVVTTSGGMDMDAAVIRRVVSTPFALGLRLSVAVAVSGACSLVFAQSPPWSPAAPQLAFSTYLGGGSPVCQGCAARTFAQNAASDAWGNTYVTGATTVTDLAGSACRGRPAANSTLSAFVAKYDAYGRLLWCTYLGGDNQSMGVGVAVMPDGGAAVGGMTQSDASQPFPTLNAFQTQNNGKSDYFVSVLDATGALRYSTYLGGSDVDGEVDENGDYVDNSTNGNNIAVDAHGLVYLTGTTKSRGGTAPAIKFPVTWNAIQPNMTGKSDTTDAFLCILDPAKSGPDSLLYCSFLGGGGNEKGHSVAVNAAGTAIAVAGYTDSYDFPTTPNGYRTVPPPQFQSNGFVAQFQVARHYRGSVDCRYATQYSTYLGGVSAKGADSHGPRDDTYSITFDRKGLILATGRTQSADFPMSPYGRSIYNSAPYLQPGQSNDQPYLVKIDPSLIGEASLACSTFLGGAGFCTGVVVDPTGNAWVAGENDADGIEYTRSYYPVESPKLFPYTKDALIPSHLGDDGTIHAILMKISRDGRSLGYSTYLGGTNNDRSYGLAVDRFGNVVVSGVTSSQDFPLKNPAQTWPTGSTQNAFITKFSTR
jgi:Beta-propeller repeat